MRPVATQSMTTKMPKYRSEAPRSFCTNRMARDPAHASTTGARCLAGGSRKGPDPGRRHLEQLALLVQVGREEDHDEDLAELGRLEAERSDLDPQARAVDGLPDPRDHRQHQQDQPEQADRVGVGVEHLVVPNDHQRRRERHEPDGDPRRLLGGETARQPEDHREAQTDEDAGRREQRRVGARREPADDQQPAHVPDGEDRRVQRRRWPAAARACRNPAITYAPTESTSARTVNAIEEATRALEVRGRARLTNRRAASGGSRRRGGSARRSPRQPHGRRR